MSFKNKNLLSGKRGFTLIELLVVISIIGLLSSIVLASLSGARAKARDAARVQSMLQLRNALEMYRIKNGNYPMAAYGFDANYTSGAPSDFNITLSSLVTEGDISKLPDDVPTTGGTSYKFAIIYGTPVGLDGSVTSLSCGGFTNLQYILEFKTETTISLPKPSTGSSYYCVTTY